ncbi:hypothetical protein TNCV_2400441 [Trichonephila clavipes]|uniref:Uncharacterized protein n=1 Tax=Trichonephila clavipes TaxID=2585209 RepID=A0A8X6SV61_TRICX|nr:hypothetical protein TNCV_2400441 [Trichonephila clavipes]
MQVTVRFCSVLPQFRRRKTWGWSGASHLSSPPTNHMRGLAARRLFREPTCRKDIIHLQTSMSSKRHVSSTSLDHGSKLRGPLRKSPRVAEQCDVNIQPTNQSIVFGIRTRSLRHRCQRR